MSASVSRQEISHTHDLWVLHDQVRAIIPWPTARSLPSGVALGGECPPRCADRARRRRAMVAKRNRLSRSLKTVTAAQMVWSSTCRHRSNSGGRGVRRRKRQPPREIQTSRHEVALPSRTFKRKIGPSPILRM